MRVMVLGSGGMLGHDVVATAPRDVDVIALTRGQLDITDKHALESRIASVRPQIIINAAAYTAVDKAESETGIAFSVNADAVAQLGQIASNSACKVVHFSTDYVFDGTSTEPYREDAPPNPRSVYGASKLAGEMALSTSGAHYVIIRTQWLYGARGRSFPRTMWERAQAGLPTRVVSDQVGRPTYTADLAAATWRLIELGITGLLHVASSGTATWFELASHLFRAAGALNLLAPCSSAEHPTPAARPQFSVLHTSTAEAVLGGALPHWTDGIERFIHSVLERAA